MDSPVDILNKAFQHTASSRVAEQVTHCFQENSMTNKKSLMYEDEIPTGEESV